jgi:hypothetical protein
MTKKREVNPKTKTPIQAEYFGWTSFVAWAKENGVDLDYEEDWLIWWQCWKAGFVCGTNN